MNRFFDNQDEPQTNKLKKTSYGQKVFDMVKGINIEFWKKKKKKFEADGTKTRKKSKQDKMEEEGV
jgi:hypothetical protein